MPQPSHSPTETAVQGPVIETVRFRLLPGTDRAAFVTLCQQGAPVLGALPGFRHRFLAEMEGVWQDVVAWESLAAAKAALPLIMAHPDFAAMMAVIDPASIEMQHFAEWLVMPPVPVPRVTGA